MSRMRLTQQEADPIGGITAAPIVAIGAVLALAVSIGLTVAHWHEVGSPVAAVLGIVLVGTAGLTAAVSAAPQFAPFTVDRLWLVVALAVGAAIAEYVSTIGNDRYLYDDYGPIVIGMLILSVAPYCTWISLLLAGLLAAAVLSILVVGSATATMNTVPIGALIAVNSAAVLAMPAFSARRSASASSRARSASATVMRSAVITPARNGSTSRPSTEMRLCCTDRAMPARSSASRRSAARFASRCHARVSSTMA